MSANISPSLAILDDLANTEESTQELGQTILEAFRELRDSYDTVAEVLVFTDRTEGHSWKIHMTKTVASSAGFRFAGFHQPAPCSPLCEPVAEQLLTSEHLHIIHGAIADNIADTANHGADVCRGCEAEKR